MAKHSYIEAQQSRRSLLEAAITVFARQGVAATTLQNIADEAGLTRGAIYTHFRGKDELLRALLEEQVLPLERQLPADIGLEDAWHRLHEALEETLADSNCRRLCEILFHKSERVHADAPTQLRLKQLKENFRSQLTDVLNRSIQTGELSTQLDVAAAGQMLCACVRGIVFESLEKPAHENSIPALLDSLLHMLRHPPVSLLVHP